MKYTLSALIAVMFTFFGISQVPQQFNYQAIARNSSGIPLKNSSLKIRLSVLDNTSKGRSVYSEIRQVKTNLLGLFTVAIGGAGSLSRIGKFEEIEWGNGQKFIKVEVDFKGGDTFSELGTTQLLSVPYALYALNSGNNDKGKSLRSTIDGTIYTSDGTITSNRNVLLNSNNLYFKGGDVSFDGIRVDNTNLFDGNFKNSSKGILRFGAGYSGEAIGSNRGQANNKNGLDFYTSYSSRISITNNGNVGIGTTSPATKLEVAGQIKITGGMPGKGKILTSDENGLASWQMAAPALAVDNFFTTDGKLTSNRIIDQNSYTLSFTNGIQNLEGILVDGDNKFSGDISNSNYFIRFGSTVSGEGIGSKRTSGGNSGGLDFFTGHSPKMSITNSGNVGIGTISPEAKLDVSGQIKIRGGVPAQGKVLVSDEQGLARWEFISGSSGTDNLGNHTATQNLNLNNHSIINLNSFSSNSATISGNSYPTNYGNSNQVLATNGSGSLFWKTINESNSNNNTSDWSTAGNTNANSNFLGTTDNSSLILKTNNTERLRILENGRIGIGTNAPAYDLHIQGAIGAVSYNCVSDRRLKHQILSLPYSQNVWKIRPVSYILNSDPSKKTEFGVVAQELEELFPELVSTGTDGFKSVKYDRISILLLRALQEEIIKNDLKFEKLEKTINLLLEQVSTLKKN